MSRDKLAWINAQIEDGKTVVISTHLKATAVDAKTVSKWRRSGRELFKATDKSLYMAHGNNWVCIDYCRISAHE